MTHLRALALILPLASLAGAARAQDPRPFDPRAVPMRGARPEAFAPAGWKISAETSGDLNGDGRPDFVLHMVPRDDPDPSGVGNAPSAQALVIVLANSGGGWRRAGVSPGVLVTDMPQWGLRLEIRRGVLVVNQNYGWSDVWDITHRFRLDAPSGRFILIGRDQLQYHRPQGMYDNIHKSENYVTGVRLVTIDHLQRDSTYRESVRRQRIPRSRTTFEQVRELEDP